MKNRLRKIMIPLLIAVMLLGLVTGCSSGGDSNSGEGSTEAFSVTAGAEKDAAADEQGASAGFTVVSESEEDSVIGGSEDAAAMQEFLSDLEESGEALTVTEDAGTEETLSGEENAGSTAGEQASSEEVTEAQTEAQGSGETAAAKITESGTYTSKEEVAAYIHAFGHLPSNYISKYDAEALGWDNSLGNLWDIAPGKSIGGNKFGNYEGLLPAKSGRKYYECDIDYSGGYRNAKRIIYSNDGLVYYTEDHYKTFEQLY